MITYEGERATPDELARLIVCEKGEAAEGYWREFTKVDVDHMTEREQEMVDEAVHKQLERVRRFLRIDEVFAKLEKRQQQRKKKLLR